MSFVLLFAVVVLLGFTLAWRDRFANASSQSPAKSARQPASYRQNMPAIPRHKLLLQPVMKHAPKP